MGGQGQRWELFVCCQPKSTDDEKRWLFFFFFFARPLFWSLLGAVLMIVDAGVRRQVGYMLTGWRAGWQEPTGEGGATLSNLFQAGLGKVGCQVAGRYRSDCCALARQQVLQWIRLQAGRRCSVAPISLASARPCTARVPKFTRHQAQHPQVSR